MKGNEKYDRLLSFLMYHCKNNPDLKLRVIFPLLNELLHQLNEPKIKTNA